MAKTFQTSPKGSKRRRLACVLTFAMIIFGAGSLATIMLPTITHTLTSLSTNYTGLQTTFGYTDAFNLQRFGLSIPNLLGYLCGVTAFILGIIASIKRSRLLKFFSFIFFMGYGVFLYFNIELCALPLLEGSNATFLNKAFMSHAYGTILGIACSAIAGISEFIKMCL